MDDNKRFNDEEKEVNNQTFFIFLFNLNKIDIFYAKSFNISGYSKFYGNQKSRYISRFWVIIDCGISVICSYLYQATSNSRAGDWK